MNTYTATFDVAELRRIIAGKLVEESDPHGAYESDRFDALAADIIGNMVLAEVR